MKTKEEYIAQLDKYKTLGRDIDFDEYKHMKELGVVQHYFRKVCGNTIYADKYYINMQDESRNSREVMQTWSGEEYATNYREILSKSAGVKTNSDRIVTGKPF